MRLVMDRLAGRIAAEFGDEVVFKGGVVLELRLAEARATKDLDLRLVGDPDQALARIRRAGRSDLGDHLVFEVQPDPRHPTIDAEGMQYEELRFRVQARLAGKVYGGPFGVDVAFAEPLVGEPELLSGSGILEFAGVPPPTLRVYPLETHIAEKLHAYTMPRSPPNSRVKDLPDIALLARVRAIDAPVLRRALRRTFEHRDVHPVPSALPEPPSSWRVPYDRLASRDRLPWSDLDAVFEAARGFIEPALMGGTGRWDPVSWVWRTNDEKR
ncbi:MAG: nucleotidyl transferase AbiEii/AbiGii toxin family protein [Deltaproteobacteria bacterium]|nr:nucleotidyl transferase AbiEii/AbiGii toxin family protein [Deltaproteobacteria bacterium]